MAGTTDFTFKAKLRIGNEIVPIKTEVVTGADNTQNGVQNGFLFQLDLLPGQVVTVNFSDVVDFIENKLGQQISRPVGPDPVNSALPQLFDGSAVAVDIQSFLINSSETEKLFSISLDVHGTDPTEGLISLPGDLAKWLKIDDIAIAFTCKKTTSNSPS